MEDDWSDELNDISDDSLKKIKMTKEAKLPLEKDICKFFSKMIDKIDNFSKKKATNSNDHQQLCQALIAILKEACRSNVCY